MTKRTRIIIVIAEIAIILGAIVGGVYLIQLNVYKAAIANMTYSNVNISAVPDGSYIGTCDVGFIYAKVEVTVENGAVAHIDLLEHRNERGENAEGIENDIVEQQKVDVDEISGATNSSKVIKKAVDNALASALNLEQ